MGVCRRDVILSQFLAIFLFESIIRFLTFDKIKYAQA